MFSLEKKNKLLMRFIILMDVSMQVLCLFPAEFLL